MIKEIVTNILNEVSWYDRVTFDAYYEAAHLMEKAGWDYELIERLLRDICQASQNECGHD